MFIRSSTSGSYAFKGLKSSANMKTVSRGRKTLKEIHGKMESKTLQMGDVYMNSPRLKGSLSRQRNVKEDLASLTGFGESGIVTNSGAGKFLNEFFMKRRQ